MTQSSERPIDPQKKKCRMGWNVEPVSPHKLKIRRDEMRRQI